MKDNTEIAGYMRNLLDLPEEIFLLIIPKRKQTRHAPAYRAFRSWLISNNGHDPNSLKSRLMFLNSISMNHPRPSSKIKATTGLFNCMDMASQPRKALQTRVSKELIKKRTKRLPAKKRGHLNLFKCVPTLTNYPSDTWEDLRNKTAILYTLASGRRTSNTASAKFPPESNIVYPFGILIEELGAKNDDIRRGNSMFFPPASRKEICPMEHLYKYVTHTETLRLREIYQARRPDKECPLFMYFHRKQETTKRLRSNTIAKKVADILRESGADKDEAGRRVTPRDLRSKIFNRGIRHGIPKGILKQIQAYKLEDVQEAKYLEEGSPKSWVDWVFGLREDCPFDDESWINIETQSKRLKEDHSPACSSSSILNDHQVPNPSLKIVLRKTPIGYTLATKK
ncbi:MAG: hypothetical protein ACAH17_02155 [Candidatus Paceibacterota bacterium]